MAVGAVPRSAMPGSAALENTALEDTEAPDAHAAALLDGTALAVFRLNGRLLSVAERLAAPAGLTAAGWQVLGAAGKEPRSVAGIARTMGITRQSVQRVADVLVRRGLAAYRPNPAHRRAKLLSPTPAGRTALARITPRHAAFAERLQALLGGRGRFAETVAVLEYLATALEGYEEPA